MEFKEEVYLPSAMEIEEMNRDEFESWIFKASRVLQKRAEKRDPLFHLKKQISKILNDNEITEETKETRVLHEIDRYNRITSQSQ
ncbi:hypothetical protein [Schinkia azotoformans]|uniref:hypothetical protein n=1 Tax=Schinkia azotoformans TaxID=1454 RepID=UPI002DB72D54|nr:hypothetical protein [Schinkia azotoformans]MEC1744158.1 hypothetical protein [Schinkia azotoformans]